MFRSTPSYAAACCLLLAACSESTPLPPTAPGEAGPVNVVEITPGETSVSAGNTAKL